MFVAVVHILVKPEQVEVFIEATADNHRHTRQEQGNRRFDVLRSTEQPNRFYLYEVYDSEEMFRAHQRTEHYLRWKAAVADAMAEPRHADKAQSLFPDPWQ